MYACLFNQINKGLTASIHYWHLWSVYFYQTIINTHSYQCSKHMFYRAYFGTIKFKSCSAAGICYKVTICFYNWFSWKVDALKLDAKTRSSRLQSEINKNTGMQTST